jgi:tRNA(adenine34) deaminase
MSPKTGCAGSVMNLMQVPVFNHRVEITRGILEQECSDMLKDFFENLRSSKKRQKESAGDSGTD